MTFIFCDYNKFDSWLQQYNYFTDGHILNIKKKTISNQIEFTLSQYVSFNNKPNSINNFQVFNVIVRELIQASQWNNSDINYNRYILPIQLNSNTKNISFVIDIKQPIIIYCKSLEIIKQPRLKKLYKPYLDDDAIFIKFLSEKPPAPQQWSEWFAHYNINIAWRYYCSEAIDINKVPTDDYSGWFIQEIDKILTTKQGLFFKYCDLTEQGFDLAVEKNQFSKRNWYYFKRILCQFNNFEVFDGLNLINDREYKKIILNKS